jgi:hypothetical protein
MHKSLKSKTENRGLLTLYLGRALDHSDDTYQFYNISTQKVIINRNAKFLNIMYSEYFQPSYANNQYAPLMTAYDDDDDELDTSPVKEFNLSIANPTMHTYNTRSSNNHYISLPHPHLPENIENDDDDVLPDLVIDDNDFIQPPQIDNNNPIYLFGASDKDQIFTHNWRAPPDEQYATPTTKPPRPPTTKLSREMRRLDGFFNPEATHLYATQHQTPTLPATFPEIPTEPTTMIPETTEITTNNSIDSDLRLVHQFLTRHS